MKPWGGSGRSIAETVVILVICRVVIDSGLFTPGFGVCCLQRGRRPGKTCHVQWSTWTLGEHVEEWHSLKKVSVLPIAITDHTATEHLQSFSGSGHLTAVRNVPLLHTSTQHPGISLHDQAFSRVGTATTNVGWKCLGTRVPRTPNCSLGWIINLDLFYRNTSYPKTQRTYH